MLRNRTQPLSIYKIRAHTNIQGNEKVDKLAKAGNDLFHRPPRQDFEHAHSTPYYLYRDWWNTIAQPPYKGPIRHLHKYIHESDRTHTLEELAHSFLIFKNGQMTLTLTKTYPCPSGTNQISQTPKLHASLNSDLTSTWVMLVNNYSLVLSYFYSLHAPFAIPKNPTRGYTYYLPVNNNTYTPYASQDITKL
jgi:hypothetical protein